MSVIVPCFESLDVAYDPSLVATLVTGLVSLDVAYDPSLVATLVTGLVSLDVAYDPSLVATLVTGLVSLDVVYVGTYHCHIVCLLDEGSGIGPLCHFSDIPRLGLHSYPPIPHPTKFRMTCDVIRL